MLQRIDMTNKTPMKLHPPGDVDPYRSTIEVSKSGDVVGSIVTITLLDKDGNAPDAYRMERTTIELHTESTANGGSFVYYSDPPVRGGLDPVNVFKTVITPLNLKPDVHVVVAAKAVRKADCDGNDANTVDIRNQSYIHILAPSGVKPIVAGRAGYMHIDPQTHTNDALQFATTVTVLARGTDMLPITTDISPLLELHVTDQYPSERGGQKRDIGKFVAADLANGVYTATFATDRISVFEMQARYKGPMVGRPGTLRFSTGVTTGKGTKLSIPDAVEGPEKVFTVKGKKGGDTLTMLVTIVNEDGKTLLDAPATGYVAAANVGDALLKPAKQQPQRESIAFDYVIPTPPAETYHIFAGAIGGCWYERYTLKLVEGEKMMVDTKLRVVEIFRAVYILVVLAGALFLSIALFKNLSFFPALYVTAIVFFLAAAIINGGIE